MTADSGWMTVCEAVRWIAFRNGEERPPAEAAPSWWWDRWGSPPSLCGTRHELLPVLTRLAVGPGSDRHPPPELVRRVSGLVECSGKSAAVPAAEIAAELSADLVADLAIYAAWRRQETEAETELRNAAARGAVQIFGYPVNPADPFQQQPLAGSLPAPIAAVVFAEDSGGFRLFEGAATYGARLRPGGFDSTWRGSAWTRMKVERAAVVHQWRARPVAKAAKRCCTVKALEHQIQAYIEAHRFDAPGPTRAVRKKAILAACSESIRLNPPSTAQWTKRWQQPDVPESWRKAGPRGGKTRKSKRN